MRGEEFDQLSRRMGAATTRRGLLRVLLVGLATAALGWVLPREVFAQSPRPQRTPTPQRPARPARTPSIATPASSSAGTCAPGTTLCTTNGDTSVCCSAGETCKDVTVGQTTTKACTVTCADGAICVTSAGDACTDAGCCPKVLVCGSACCREGQRCLDGLCCDGDSVPVSGQCCLAVQACGTTCCPAGQVCASGQCCPIDGACGDTCCPSGQFCVYDTSGQNKVCCDQGNIMQLVPVSQDSPVYPSPVAALPVCCPAPYRATANNPDAYEVCCVSTSQFGGGYNFNTATWLNCWQCFQQYTSGLPVNSGAFGQCESLGPGDCCQQCSTAGDVCSAACLVELTDPVLYDACTNECNGAKAGCVAACTAAGIVCS